MCEALRSSIDRRTGGMLERLSVACLHERIRIEAVCRSYYVIQLALSAIATASGERRRRPIDLTVRVNGRSMTLHLSPTTSQRLDPSDRSRGSDDRNAPPKAVDLRSPHAT
jgi:hypothetical protein